MQRQPQITTNTNLPFDTSTMLFLAIGGIIVKLFLSGGITKDGSTGPASATIWGYGLTSMALIGLLLGVINLSSKETMGLGVFDTLKKLFSSSFPVISTLVVLCWIVIINMTFMERINKGKIAPDFNQFSFFSTILIIFQIMVVFKYILGKMGKTLAPKDNPMAVKIEQTLSTELSSVTLILTLLNLIFAGMMQVVAEFFSTDG
jgi:hypothetical protein